MKSKRKQQAPNIHPDDLAIITASLNPMMALNKAVEQRNFYREQLEEAERRIAELQRSLWQVNPIALLPEQPKHSDEDVTRIAEENGVPVVNWGDVCVVYGRLFVKYGGAQGDTEVFQFDHVTFPGSLDDAKRELLEPIAARLWRVPTTEDIRENEIPGVKTGDYLAILADLTLYRYALRDQYIAKRLEAFHRVSARMLQSGTFGRAGLRPAREFFKDKVELAFKNAEKRRAKGWGIKAEGGEKTPPP